MAPAPWAARRSGVRLLPVAALLQATWLGALASESEPGEKYTYDCAIGYQSCLEDWRPEQQTWCYHHKGLACPAPPSPAFDCEKGFSEWKMGWSDVKKDFCCREHGRACSSGADCEVESDGCETRCRLAGSAATCGDRVRTLAAALGWKGNDPCTKAHEQVAKLLPACSKCLMKNLQCAPHDCAHGLLNWKGLWSKEKLAWCCENRSVCPADREAEDAARLPGASGDAETTTAAATTATAVPPCSVQCTWKHQTHSCKDRVIWSSQHELSQAENPCREAHLKVIQYCPRCGECTQEDSKCAAAEKYDCMAGMANWTTMWSEDKKLWCCQNRVTCKGFSPNPVRSPSAAGSPAAAGFPPGADVFDCDDGFWSWQNHWSPAKKEWCCKTAKRGCEREYDCDAEFSMWRMAWSEKKAEYCCEAAGRGCPDSTTPEAHDCTSDYGDWELAWSEQKKVWCCDHGARWSCAASTMPPSGSGTTSPQAAGPTYDCEGNLEQGWSSDEKAWCCTHRGRGCGTTTTTRHYDCYDGRRRSWSREKQRWCCERRRVNCNLDADWADDQDARAEAARAKVEGAGGGAEEQAWLNSSAVDTVFKKFDARAPPQGAPDRTSWALGLGAAFACALLVAPLRARIVRGARAVHPEGLEPAGEGYSALCAPGRSAAGEEDQAATEEGLHGPALEEARAAILSRSPDP